MNLSEQEHNLLVMLEQMLRTGIDVRTAASQLKGIGTDPDQVDRVVNVRTQIAADRRSIAKAGSLVNASGVAAPWYTGPSADDRFWPALKASLEADPRWSEAVPSLDEASTNIVALLADPHAPTIATRGLVVGHVQSGKTANFTATIAKAADAGYRLFVVLSGVHNALRKQTQVRLDHQLYELTKHQWVALTDEERDFGNPVKALALLNSTDLRIYAVVKKNASRLEKLNEWLGEAHRYGGLDSCPVLIIDDESDQASPNTAPSALANRTRVNELIEGLLSLPRVAYIGYTATPFANVLINPAESLGLYPRDFIVALQKPPSYFGSEELFGIQSDIDSGQDESLQHNVIRTVDDAEAARYLTQSSTRSHPVVTESLASAIRWFVMATAARRKRSAEPAHSSMLVHTTMRVQPQLELAEVISDFVSELRKEWGRGERATWERQWEREITLEPPSRFDYTTLGFAQISETVAAVLSDVKTVADNSSSTDRLLYGSDPATVIAVGGNTLSRGLTLEGLVSSFFLRSASTYDALLQMGRWFGYRPGYEDLPRIWTTDGLAVDFRFLAEVETEIRQEIERYADAGKSPSELPVRIRTHPRMQVTARNKMQFAVRSTASYGGLSPQTTYFNHRNADELEENRAAGARLLSRAIAEGAVVDDQKSRVILRDVPLVLVKEFVASYKFNNRSDLRADLLLQYIADEESEGALTTWNVAVISRASGGGEMDLGLPAPVRTITRSRLTRYSTDATANIGALISKADRVADVMDSASASLAAPGEILDARRAADRALLMLYPIDRDSTPEHRQGQDDSVREPLGARDHVLGLAFSFPPAKHESQPADTIEVDPALLFAGALASEDQDDEGDDVEGTQDEVDLDE